MVGAGVCEAFVLLGVLPTVFLIKNYLPMPNDDHGINVPVLTPANLLIQQLKRLWVQPQRRGIRSRPLRLGPHRIGSTQLGK